MFGQRDLHPDQHENKRLKGDADEERACQINELAVLERGCERRNPAILLGSLLIFPSYALHADQPAEVEQLPEREAGEALFAEHFKIGAMVSASLIGLD